MLAWVFVRAPHRLHVQANWLLLLPLDVGVCVCFLTCDVVVGVFSSNYLPEGDRGG